jgi:hypothetical protein
MGFVLGGQARRKPGLLFWGKHCLNASNVGDCENPYAGLLPAGIGSILISPCTAQKKDF